MKRIVRMEKMKLYKKDLRLGRDMSVIKNHNIDYYITRAFAKYSILIKRVKN